MSFIGHLRGFRDAPPPAPRSTPAEGQSRTRPVVRPYLGGAPRVKLDQCDETYDPAAEWKRDVYDYRPVPVPSKEEFEILFFCPCCQNIRDVREMLHGPIPPWVGVVCNECVRDYGGKEGEYIICRICTRYLPKTEFRWSKSNGRYSLSECKKCLDPGFPPLRRIPVVVYFRGNEEHA
ncbi:hypothetical protein F5Y07DRAFT_381719 [Xylaria sp. FL0933]|nr:hypothetical protein F5Y07DRAFT_381719 [Xylaria sp. FL0933]